ncbi:MAG: hypothetical protein IKP95_01995 [Ruminococcus sp.]|nr:hypothetical protein [Ruminococcus sp.]
MKNPVPVLIFRILLILTAIAGMLYLVFFMRLANAPATMTNVEFLSACRLWTYFFVGYLALTGISAVLSGMTFSATSKLTAIIRTAVLVFALIGNILSIRYISVFRGYEEAYDAADAINQLMRKGTAFIIMSFIGAMLVFFLMITSIYTIATRSSREAVQQKLEELRAKDAEKKKQQK